MPFLVSALGVTVQLWLLQTLPVVSTMAEPVSGSLWFSALQHALASLSSLLAAAAVLL